MRFKKQWDYASLNEYSKFLGIPLAEIVRFAGEEPKRIYNWRLKNDELFPKNLQKRLSQFRKEVPRILEEKKMKELEKKSKMEQQEKLQHFKMDSVRMVSQMFGLSQIEIACICNVSPDSVISWCKKRRSVEKLEHLDFFNLAIEFGKKRKFKLPSREKYSAHHLLLKNLPKEKVYRKHVLKNNGEFPLIGGEIEPGVFREFSHDDKVKIQLSGNEAQVEIKMNKRKILLLGTKRKVNRLGINYLTYSLRSKAISSVFGCLHLMKNLGTIVLVSKNLPVRILFPYFHEENV